MATLSEIFVQLPPDTADLLEKLLEGASIPSNPTREQVLAVATEVAAQLKGDPPESEEKLLTLLSQLPQAIADQLFC